MPQPTDGGFTFTPQELALMGFYLFPCQGKQPLVKWRDKSTTELPTIERWIKRYPGCWWGVDCGKSGLAVLDDDRGKNRQAIASLLDLTLQYGELPDTFTVRTPTTGFHYYMRGHCRNSASDEKKLGAGLDSRGDGGYVIAPCSPGYVALSADKKIAAAPEWFIELTSPREPQKRSITDVSTVLDTDAAVKRAIEYLEAAMPAIEGQGGDAHTYKVACAVRDFGISPDLCLELMLEHWDYRNEPPWGEELAVKVDNAYSYAENSVGSLDPASVFDEFIDDEPADTGPRFKLLRSGDIQALPSMDWRVKGLIPSHGVFQVYGPSTAGKSFFIIDMMAAVAEGAEWQGRKTKQCQVVYVCLEGEAGLKQRLAAWEMHNGRPLPYEFAAMVQPWSIIKRKDVADLAEIIPANSVVIIDTQNSAAPTINESASEDMGALLMGAKTLARKIGGTVGLIAHTGKDESRGSRGHSSQLPTMDATILVTREDDIRTWKAIKVKDGLDGETGRFKLRVVDLWKDEDGDMVSSCVVDWDTVDPCDGKGYHLSDIAAAMWLTVKFLASSSKSGWVLPLAWKEATMEQLATTGGRTFDKKFSKGKSELLKKGLVVETNGAVRVAVLTAVETED